MNKKRTYSFLVSSLMLFLAAVQMPAVAAVVNAEWISGSGNYSDDTKWNIPAVPCNAGSTTFNVNIPTSIGTVSMDVPPPDCTVETLTLGASTVFNVLSGNSYTVLGLADIAGIVNGVGGDFLAPIAVFSGNTARASASGGATVQIGAPDYSATGLVSTTLFSCSGTGSVLDLSSLQSIDSSFNDGTGTVYANSITASGDASLDLSGVTEITAPARGEDRLDINVSDTSVIDLSSLATISGGGTTRFVVTAGAVQLLPALQTVSRGRFDVSGGSRLSTDGSDWTYINQLVSVPLFTVSGTGSVLDLSSLQSIDSSFNDGTGTVYANSITASGDASLDLSGVTEITAPARGEDRLDINVSDTSVIDLSSLATISGGGTTRFVVTAGAVQLLPALQTVSRGRFDVSGGSRLSTDGSDWTYINQLVSVPLFTVSGTGSVLDLSSLQSIDSSFNDGTGTVYANSITASSDARLDLSGVTKITAPARGEDRLDINVSDTAVIDLSSLETTNGGGQTRFNVTTGGVLLLPKLKTITGGGAQINLSTGTEVKIGDLSGVTATTTIKLNDADTSIVAVGSLLLTPSTSIISVADAMISIANDYIFEQTDENKIDLESAVVKFNGSGQQLVEVGGFDIGTLTPVGPNFGFGQMIVSTNTQATTVYLRDGVNNGNGHDLFGPGVEALYLLGLPDDPLDPGKIVNGLRILGGSTLVLNGIPLYVMQDGYLQDVRDWFPMGQRVIAYSLNNSNGYIDLGTSPDTDADIDGVLDINDNCALVPNPTQCDGDMDGYGNHCDADFNNDLIVNNLDTGPFKAGFGTTDPVTDLNCDGITNNLDVGFFRALFGNPPGPSSSHPTFGL